MYRKADRAQESPAVLRCIIVTRLPKSRLDQALAALVITLVLVGIAVLLPKAGQWLSASRAAPTPVPTPSPTAPPSAVLLPEELDRDLQGVMTIVSDHTFATAFLIDPQGDFLTAASVVNSSPSLRLVDNTGGSHSVRVIGVDVDLGIAMVRAGNDGTPLAFGDPGPLQADDPVVLLASPKVVNLRTSTPAVLVTRSDTQLTLRVDILPGNLGGPIVGPGGKVVGILIASGRALPITVALTNVAQWRHQDGTAVPLAPLPSSLVLRGSDTTSAPSSGPSIQSVSPTRASAAQDTLVTIHGSGFTDGKMLRVQFVPLASPSGDFDGLTPTFVNPSTLTVKVPAGRVVQDYIVQVTNGNGSVTSSRIAFTVTP
jgi:S1-C subfamily serine protease